MPLLEALRVSKIYRIGSEPVIALRDISFAVEQGDFIAVVGRSGGGKSTLLNLCGAMDFPTAGEIRIDGQSTTNLPDRELTVIRRQKVGFIFQSFQLVHTMTAAENVELPILLARKKGARNIARERLRWVEMDEYENRFPHQLSGGQQQRIAIARALANDPKLLLADEPTGNLDTATGDSVLKLLERTARDLGVAILMATHSAESAAVVNRTFRLRDGQLLEAALVR